MDVLTEARKWTDTIEQELRKDPEHRNPWRLLGYSEYLIRELLEKVDEAEAVTATRAIPQINRAAWV